MNNEKEIKTNVITNDAFDSNDKFKKESDLIFLSLTDKSYKDLEINHNPKIFKMKVFQSIQFLPTFHSSWEYLYAIEIDNGKFLKIGYSKTPKHRLKFHNNSSESLITGRCNRVAIIGPIRDGINTEQIIHNYMGRFYAKEDFPSSNEIYSLDKFTQTLGEKQTNIIFNNLFDVFCGTTNNFNFIDECGGLFGIIQSWYYGESTDSCLYPQDLIVPKVNF